jgi:hypothetical protein
VYGIAYMPPMRQPDDPHRKRLVRQHNGEK